MYVDQVLQTVSQAAAHTWIAHMHYYSTIYTVVAYLPKTVLSYISLPHVRHQRVNIWFELDGSGALWCQYQDQFGHRCSLYTALSWPEIPQPTLVNTPTDLKTNCAGADKHVGPSRLYSKWHEGRYHINAPIDSDPSYNKHCRYRPEERHRQVMEQCVEYRTDFSNLTL